MGIQNLSEDVILVDLPLKEPQIADELKAVNETVSSKPDLDVIIDFSRVEIITSSSIGNLIILRNLLHERGRRLILCNMASVTKCIFVVAGLKDIFEFVDDKSAALAAVQHAVSGFDFAHHPQSSVRSPKD
jgi:anti-anti-sigma factor